MDVLYKPPTEDKLECAYLRRNMITCLKEKALRDEVADRKCNIELLLWFNLECPEHFKEFKDPVRLAKLHQAEKALDNSPNPPKFIKLGW